MADFKLDHDGDVNDCIEEVGVLKGYAIVFDGCFAIVVVNIVIVV